ncbi:MAG: hypothetical protein M9958_12620 [Chitinophagales bacterium]|nr:hypothetical protein [Chitinophagales bacterium]
MKNTYALLLSLVIGWSTLGFISGHIWIAYLAVAVGFIGIISESFAKKFLFYIHLILQFVFQILQKAILTILYYTVFTFVAFVNKNKNHHNNWLDVKEKGNKQLERLW